MKDLEDIYLENYLAHNFMGADRNPPIRPKTSIKQHIDKVQGLFNSLKIEIGQLKDALGEREDDDNGFTSTLETIDGSMETPFAIFDSTFFQNKNKF